MISEWFLSIAAGIQEWFLGLFGEDEPPEWLDGVAAFVSDIIARAAGLGAWVPFPLLGSMLAGVLAIWAGFWLVKGIRWIWGLTPFSGGS